MSTTKLWKNKIEKAGNFLQVSCCFFVLFVLGIFFSYTAYAGTLSCSVTTAAACTGTVILRMSDATNAHAELSSQATAVYDNNVVCCSGVTGLGNSCSGTYATALKLSATTNAHAQQSGSYPQSACISVSSGSVSVGYQATNCSGYDTTLASMKATTNSHVGNTTAYGEYKICGTAAGGAPVYSVAITPAGDIEYGFVNLSNSTTTIGSTYTKTATNDGDSIETLNVKSSDATTGTTWTLASAIGTNQFKHEFSTTTGALWTVMPDNVTYVTAKPSVAVSGTATFDFRLTAPSLSSDYQQKSITITVQAVAP